jgi:adenylylsulfate kinase
MNNEHKSVALWFTGLSGSGKSTLSRLLEEQLRKQGCQTYIIDGDNMRRGLCKDLGYSIADRTENIRRIGEVTKLVTDAGLITLTAVISPIQSDRDRVRDLFEQGDFIEVYCKCDLSICEQRDVKGLYKRARTGEIPEFTGISSPYEEPLTPEIILDTGKLSPDECIQQLLSQLTQRNIFPIIC